MRRLTDEGIAVILIITFIAGMLTGWALLSDPETEALKMACQEHWITTEACIEVIGGSVEEVE